MESLYILYKIPRLTCGKLYKRGQITADFSWNVTFAYSQFKKNLPAETKRKQLLKASFKKSTVSSKQ